MALFSFLKKENSPSEKIESEYQKALGKVLAADLRCSSLVRDIKRYAESTCQPQEGDDLLAKKAEFVRLYAFRAYQWRCYHTLNYKRGKFNAVPLWTQKWHDYEQGSRQEAQKKWREMLMSGKQRGG